MSVRRAKHASVCTSSPRSLSDENFISPDAPMNFTLPPRSSPKKRACLKVLETMLRIEFQCRESSVTQNFTTRGWNKWRLAFSLKKKSKEEFLPGLSASIRREILLLPLIFPAKLLPEPTPDFKRYDRPPRISRRVLFTPPPERNYAHHRRDDLVTRCNWQRELSKEIYHF